MRNRNDLYRIFINERKDYFPIGILNQIFKSLSDEELASEFGLKVLRRGYFCY